MQLAHILIGAAAVYIALIIGVLAWALRPWKRREREVLHGLAVKAGFGMVHRATAQGSAPIGQATAEGDAA